jgi:hypothetical protein
MTLRCGQQTYFRYVKNIIIPPGVAARKGSGTHAGIEHDYRTKISTGKLAPLDEVKDAAHDKFMKLVKDEGVWMSPDDQPEKQTILNTALNESLACAEFYHKNFAPFDDEIQLSEQKLEADIGLPMPIEGTPDIVVDACLRDNKTSGKRWNQGRENEEIQPAFYRILLKENGYGDIPGEFVIMTNMKKGPQKGEACIWDDELKVCGDRREANNSPDFIESTKARIEIVAKQIIMGNFVPSHPSSWWCSPGWCGYFGICQYSKGRKLI